MWGVLDMPDSTVNKNSVRGEVILRKTSSPKIVPSLIDSRIFQMDVPKLVFNRFDRPSEFFISTKRVAEITAVFICLEILR